MPIKFFTATATDNDKREAKACRLALTPESNLSQWWERYVNSFTWFGFLRSCRTKQLTQAINQFQESVTSIIEAHEQRRKKALLRLYNQVKHWKMQHDTLRLSSRRTYQVDLLIDWVEQQLAPDQPQKNQTQQASDQHQAWLLSATTNFDAAYAQTHDIAPCQSEEQLYDWWKAISKLRFYQRRSQATKDLDKTIHWYCNNVIFDKKQAYINILAAIECWKQARSGKSQRLDAIGLLEHQLRTNIRYIDKYISQGESSEHNLCPIPWQASFTTLICTLYQWCFELSSSLELELLFT